MTRGSTRDKLKHLRHTVHELENAIVVLLSEQGFRNERWWEEEAQRQFERRLRVEMERIELEATLQEQRALLKRIRRVLFRRRSNGVMELLRLQTRAHINMERPSRGLAFITNDLWDGLRGMEERIDLVLSDPRFALLASSSATSFMHVLQRHDPFLGDAVEIAYAHTYPFNLQDTVDAHWRMNTERIRAVHDVPCKTVEITEDTVTSSFECVGDIFNEPCLFRGTMVSRRIRRADGVVVMWSLAGTTDASHSRLAASVLRFRGWDMLEDSTASGYATVGAPRTVLRSFIVTSPEPVNESIQGTAQQAAASELTKYLLETAGLYSSSETQAVGNYLLEDSANASSTSRIMK